MWGVDSTNGQVIHLGGEYTCGECQEGAQRFSALIKEYVPTGPDAVQVVLPTDGMEWIRTWVFPQIPDGTVFIVDFYHAIAHTAEVARTRFGTGAKAAKARYSRVRTALFGTGGYTRRTQKTREDHRKSKRHNGSRKRTTHPSDNQYGAGEAPARQLIDTTVPEKHDKALNKLLHYVSQNADHMDSPRYRTRGMSVRSPAMASFHPIASQMRLKLAGARWLPKNALTIRNARMMTLAGRWAEFWDSPELTLQLQMAFGIGQEQAMKPVD
jgi:hypothetical protein